MTFREELQAKVDEFAVTRWPAIPDAYVVPDPIDLTFGNDGRHMDVCILYADLHRSTEMVDALPEKQTAEYYKAFLHCAAKILKAHGGDIQAYDGDRVMAVFVGETHADMAVWSALEIFDAVNSIINPTFQRVYTTIHRQLRHTVGIDAGKVLVAKTGVRIDSDLVWIGPAANYAAKLNSFSGLDPAYPTRITSEAFAKLSRGARYGDDGTLMWEGPYNNVGTRDHYRSKFLRTL
jgi:class 3 adenylate cyclase